MKRILILSHRLHSNSTKFSNVKLTNLNTENSSNESLHEIGAHKTGRGYDQNELQKSCRKNENARRLTSGQLVNFRIIPPEEQKCILNPAT